MIAEKIVQQRLHELETQEIIFALDLIFIYFVHRRLFQVPERAKISIVKGCKEKKKNNYRASIRVIWERNDDEFIISNNQSLERRWN